ncbi:hypothetical protein D7Z26_19010 [Cohnella endophytica]|uniref:Uncharacterized protein n=1 Tax=Cohnella endophytica TaxID=2419778 RepID=A0A494XP66_9BACL|nr:hypothetical protein [Cohnella endophytica]RKP49919.1 hypothetical protein D7Z26_19010 [Cohnella endophytica]
MQENQTIDDHLREALAHLEQAIDQSIHAALENHAASKELGGKWEQFLGKFYGMVKDRGKKTQINVLSWISFSKIR